VLWMMEPTMVNNLWSSAIIGHQEGLCHRHLDCDTVWAL